MHFIKKIFGKSKYQNLNLKIVISAVAAFFICAQSNQHSFSQLMLRKEYYVAFITSFIIAFILMEMIHWQNYFLDKYLKWRENPISRTFILWAFGWWLPTKGAWIMAAIYFKHNGYDIEQTGYERHLYDPIRVFIALINFYYNWDLFKKEPTEPVPANEEPADAAFVGMEPAIISQPLAAAEPTIEKDLEIALIYLKNKTIFVLDTFNRPVTDWEHNTIIGSFEELSSGNYLMIGRDVIVRADMIQTIKRKKRCLELLVKLPIDRTYIVGKGRLASVRKYGEENDVIWWDKKKKKFR